MRRAAPTVLLAAILALAACPCQLTLAQETLWSNATATVLAVPSELDPHVSHLEIWRDGVTLFKSQSGYLATSIGTLWKRGYLAAGPDVVVGGHTGGSGCCFQITSFDFTGGIRHQTVTFDNLDRLDIADTEGIPHFTVPFGMAGFNAAQSSIASVLFPVVWDHGRFDAELAKLIKPLPSPSTLKTSEQTIRDELSGWTFLSYPASGHAAAAPKTVQILLELILRGHGDEAQAMLARAWPSRIAGREAYWRDLSTTVIGHRLWTQFDLARIPNAHILLTPASAR